VIPLEVPVALAGGTDTIALAERADLRHDPFHPVANEHYGLYR